MHLYAAQKVQEGASALDADSSAGPASSVSPLRARCGGDLPQMQDVVRLVAAEEGKPDGATILGSDTKASRVGAVTWRAISFGNAEHAVAPGERADIVYTFKRDDFRGGDTLQLEVLDLRPAE